MTLANPFVRISIIFVATGLIWFHIGSLLLLLIHHRLWTGAVELVSTIGIAWGIQQLMGYHWFHARPAVFNSSFHPLINPSVYSKTFPSDHSAIAFIGVVVSRLWLPEYSAIWGFSAILIAVGRVLAGVHRGIDVVAGAAVGIVVALIVHDWIVL